MGFIGRFVDWYRRRVALATGDIKKYVSAEKRVKTAIVASPVLALVSYFLYPLFGDPLLGSIVVGMLALAP
jgi:hypothetical protein